MKKKEKKLKILMLNYEFPPLGGGAGNATYYMLKEFSKYPNLEIDLVTSSVDKFRIEKFSKNIIIHFLDIGKKGNLHYQSNKDLLTYSWKAYNYSKELIKTKEFDLCHAFFGIPCGYIAMKLKDEYNIPYIVSLRGSDVPFYNKRFYLLDSLVFKRLSKKIWKNAKSVIANSEGLRELALDSNPTQKISIIYNGVDINEFAPLKNKKIGDKIILVSTGRLIKRKGYNYLIKSISELKNVELNLIGDGNLKDELVELSKIEDSSVKFLGKINHEELPKYLQKSNIFILPSLNEGMSNSVLEAMACGLPIITTDTGGSKELIKNNGFIVKQADVNSLKNAIEEYLKNPELIKLHGDNSRKLAEKMSWENVAKEYERGYKK
jgi:glycosyltransferase involved in cell wall biosynthesis